MKSFLSSLRKIDLAAVHQQQIFKALFLTGSIVGSMSLWLSTPRVMANSVPTPTQPSPLLPTRNVFNGGFEQPVQSSGAGKIVPEGYGTTPPIIWQTTEDTAPYANALEIWRGPQTGAGGLAAGSHSGNQYAELNGATNASIYQDICTIPGETVNWSVWHGARYSGETNIMQVSVTDPTLWTGKTPPATKLYNSGDLSTAFSSGWLLKQGSWVNSTTSIKPLRFAFAAIKGSRGSTSLGNFVDDINLDLSPIIDFLPTSVSQNINLASTTEGNTNNNYYLSLRINGKMQTAGSVQIDLTGLSTSRSFTLGAVLQGSATAAGLTATKSGNSITLNIPAGNYDPNLTSNYIHIPIDFSNTVIQPNDALAFTLSNATGGGGTITPNGTSLTIPQLSVTSSSCLGTPRTVVNTALSDDDVDLSITNTNGQTTATPGSAVSHNITVTNNAGTGGAGSTLNSIKVVDILSTNLQGVTFTPSTGSYDSNTGAWTGLTLAPGQSITLTVAGTVKSTATIGSSLINTATVSLPTGSTLTDINLANNTAIDPTTITATVVPSICSAAGGTLGTNLFSNGSFGTGSSTPGITGSALPAGRTTYTPVTYGSGAPNDGQYSIVNQLNQTTFDYWFNPVSGHTTGAVNDQMMVVNADYQPGTFYAETVTVPANQTMNFGFWILNLPSSNSYGWTQYGGGTAGDPNASGSNKKPDISLAVNRIGVDDNNDGVIDELGEAQVIDITGAVPFTSSPTWIQYGTLFNSGSATQIEFRLINNAPGGNGNDLALDDLTVAPCSLPSGNITGTLYRDRNTNNAYNSGTDPTMPANIAVNLKNSSDAIVATAYTDASGGYSFTNVPVGSSYTIAVILTDPDIPSGATATANPSGANTTGIQTGVTVTAGATLADRNFGFSAPAIASNPNLLLVKRITAINGNTTNGNIFLNTYDPETDITNSSYPYDKNVIQSGITPPSSDKWPNTSGISPISSSFLVGARNGGTTKPNDSIEYTIYFLSAGDSAARNVLFCDRVPDNVTFIPNTFTNTIANPSGVARGIAVQLGNTPNYYTNSGDTDPGRYFPPGIEPSTVYGTKINCGGANNNGAVVVNLGDLNNAIGVGTPLDSHGFVRFSGVVK